MLDPRNSGPLALWDCILTGGLSENDNRKIMSNEQYLLSFPPDSGAMDGAASKLPTQFLASTLPIFEPVTHEVLVDLINGCLA